MDYENLLSVFLRKFCKEHTGLLDSISLDQGLIIKADSKTAILNDKYNISKASILEISLNFGGMIENLDNRILVLIEIASKFQYLGKLECAIPRKLVCDNCDKSVSEHCHRCLHAFYCSNSCRLSSWRSHKDECLKFQKLNKTIEKWIKSNNDKISMNLSKDLGLFIQVNPENGRINVGKFPIKTLIFGLGLIGIATPCPLKDIPVVLEFTYPGNCKYIYKLLFKPKN